MLISKFNKLIHNKMVWAAFAILISLSMIGFFSPSMGNKGDNRRTSELGTLYGEPVTSDQLAQARLFALGIRGRAGSTPEEQKLLNEQAWRRLALLRTADRLGLTVSDEEMALAIQSNESFQEGGRFNARKYQALIEAQMKVRIPTFEIYFRQEMVLQKLMNLVSKTLWIAPMEIDKTIARFTDTITLKTITLDRDTFAQGVEVSEADIQSFFEENEELFREPETRSVRYVDWPISNYLAQVAVTDADVETTYNENLEDYIVPNTSTNATNATETVYKELAEVSEEIRSELQREKAFFMAESTAMDFADELAPGRYGQATPFEGVAGDAALSVSTSGMFSAYGDVPGMAVGLDFNRAAFNLDADDPSGYYSYPLRGDDAVYVLATATTRESYIPDLSNVLERVTDLATRRAEDDAFEAAAETTQEKLQALLANGMAFEQAAKMQKLEVQDVPPFSAYDASPDTMDNFSSIAPVVMGLEAGELSDPISTMDAKVIAYVEKRDPGDIATSELIRPEVVQMLQGYRVRPHFQAWADELLATVRTVHDDSNRTADDE